MYIQNILALNCSEALQCKIPIPREKVQSTVTLLVYWYPIALIHQLMLKCFSVCQMVDSDCHCISDVFTVHTTGDGIILCTFKTKS